MFMKKGETMKHFLRNALQHSLHVTGPIHPSVSASTVLRTRKATRPANQRIGFNEGEKCGRGGCQGNLVFPPVKDCSCHQHAPCWHCVENPLVCPECGAVADSEEEQERKIRLAAQIRNKEDFLLSIRTNLKWEHSLYRESESLRGAIGKGVLSVVEAREQVRNGCQDFIQHMTTALNGILDGRSFGQHEHDPFSQCIPYADFDEQMKGDFSRTLEIWKTPIPPRPFLKHSFSDE